MFFSEIGSFNPQLFLLIVLLSTLTDFNVMIILNEIFTGFPSGTLFFYWLEAFFF